MPKRISKTKSQLAKTIRNLEATLALGEHRPGPKPTKQKRSQIATTYAQDEYKTAGELLVEMSEFVVWRNEKKMLSTMERG